MGSIIVGRFSEDKSNFTDFLRGDFEENAEDDLRIDPGVLTDRQ
jgi:hypothetical protein